METVLITGATGFIAQHIAPLLQKKRYRVIGVARSQTSLRGFDAVYPSELGQPLGSLIESEHVTSVIHAALASGDDSYVLNVGGTQAWFRELESQGAKVQILLSSLTASIEAISGYGREKFELEEYFINNRQVVMRLGLVVGNGGFFHRICQSLEDLPLTPLLDNGKQAIWFIGIDRCAEIIIQCIESGGAGYLGRLHHINEKASRSLKEITEAINKGFGYQARLLRFPAKLALAGALFMEMLGLRLPVSSANIRGMIHQRGRRYPSSLEEFGYPPQEFEETLKTIQNSQTDSRGLDG